MTIDKLEKADTKTERIVKKAEAYFRLLPDSYPVFNHFDPAMYLLQHPELLEGDTKKVTESLDRFEPAFVKINSFLSD